MCNMTLYLHTHPLEQETWAALGEGVSGVLTLIKGN